MDVGQEVLDALTELGAERGTRIARAIMLLQLEYQKMMQEMGRVVEQSYTKGYNDGVTNHPRNNPPKI